MWHFIIAFQIFLPNRKCSRNLRPSILKACIHSRKGKSLILKRSLTKRSISICWSRAEHTSSSSPNSLNYTKSTNIKSKHLPLYLKNPVSTSSPNKCPKSINAKSSKLSAAKSNNSSKNLSKIVNCHNNSSTWTEKSTPKLRKG